jgi:hypothetical protein
MQRRFVMVAALDVAALEILLSGSARLYRPAFKQVIRLTVFTLMSRTRSDPRVVAQRKCPFNCSAILSP